VKRGCDIKWTKIDKTRLVAICKQSDNCKWIIYASPMQGKTTIQIKTFNPNHTYVRKFENSLVTSTYISHKYFDMLSDTPNWDVKSMKKTIRRDLFVDAHCKKIYRAKRKAIDIM